MPLEIATFSAPSAILALSSLSVDRIELCANPSLGGTTPSLSSFQAVKSHASRLTQSVKSKQEPNPLSWFEPTKDVPEAIQIRLRQEVSVGVPVISAHSNVDVQNQVRDLSLNVSSRVTQSADFDKDEFEPPRPINVMIRPARGGSFIYSDAELEEMLGDIKTFNNAGADGFVFGVLKRTYESGEIEIDVEHCKLLLEAAHPKPCTFHRAFDALPPETMLSQLEVLIELGFKSVLTSGGGSTATEGREMLNLLVKRAGGWMVPSEAVQMRLHRNMSVNLPAVLAHSNVDVQNKVGDSDLNVSNQVTHSTGFDEDEFEPPRRIDVIIGGGVRSGNLHNLMCGVYSVVQGMPGSKGGIFGWWHSSAIVDDGETADVEEVMALGQVLRSSGM